MGDGKEDGKKGKRRKGKLVDGKRRKESKAVGKKGEERRKEGKLMTRGGQESLWEEGMKEGERESL